MDHVDSRGPHSEHVDRRTHTRAINDLPLVSRTGAALRIMCAHVTTVSPMTLHHLRCALPALSLLPLLLPLLLFILFLSPALPTFLQTRPSWKFTRASLAVAVQQQQERQALGREPPPQQWRDAQRQQARGPALALGQHDSRACKFSRIQALVCCFDQQSPALGSANVLQSGGESVPLC